MMVARIHGSSIWSITLPSGMSTGLCSSCTSPLVQVDAVHHGRRGGDQVEVEFAGQPLLDDLQVQQPQEPAAEAEAQRGGGLRLIVEARVVQPQPAQRFAQLLEIVGVHRVEAAPHHRHRRLEPGQRLGGRQPVVGERVADASSPPRLDRRGDEADLAGPEVVRRDHLRAEDAHLLDLVHRALGHHADALAALDPPVLDADQDHHAEILVVPAIDQQRLQRRGAIALRAAAGGAPGPPARPRY